MHQPLHAADDGDKGGNDVHVTIGRERANLHKVWDADVVQALGYDTGADRRRPGTRRHAGAAQGLGRGHACRLGQ